MKNLALVFICLLLAIPSQAEIIIVDDDWPYDFNNIQAAIDYSTSGDFIFVFPGIYTDAGNYNINFNGKDITVQSVDPTDPYIVAATVIDCNYYAANGFYFHSDEDANSVLAGFTITNASGAIYCRNSSPTIAYCIMTGNAEGQYAGGIRLEDSNSIITNCTITDNIGSGIWCGYYSSPTITNCIISNNTGHDAPPHTRAGGIYCEQDCNPKIIDCIITGNAVGRDGGGIYCNYDSSPKITNCTITGNSAKYDGGGIYCGSHSSIFITNSIVWGNADSSGQGQSAQTYDDGDGTLLDIWFSCIQDGNSDDVNVPFGIENFNIDDDPCFVLPGYWGHADDTNIPVEPMDPNALWVDGDYHLLVASPCIEAGNPYFTYQPGDVDMDAQPRLMGPRVDMGADEFEIAIIVVTKPQGGEVWTNGSTHEINWDSYGITGTVDISYSTNNGADWLMIDNTTDSGSFVWQLPGAVDSNQCLVAVEPNIPVPGFICIESGLFTIHPDSPGPAVASKWKSLGGDFDRAGLSENYGPELGCIKWQFQADAPVSASPTIGADDSVHIACEDGKVYTLDANGLLLWSYDTNSPLLSSPTVGPDGTVYVGGQDEKLYAIDVNGSLRWTHNTDGFIYSSPAVSPDGNNVYACSQDGTLYALGQDGSELWTFETAGPGIAGGAILASPAIGPNGTVYVTGVYDPNLYALDSNDGSVIWDCNFIDPCDPNGEQPWPFASPVLAADGTIYQTLLYNPKRLVGEPPPTTPSYEAVWYDSKLYAIDPNDGSIIWATNMTETATQEEPYNPEYEPNYLFKQYYAHIMFEEGIPPYPYTTTDVGGWDVVRYYRVSNSSFSEPALAPDGTIYVSFDDQYIRAVDPNGTIKWVTSLGWLGGFTLTVGSDGLIYAASDEGYLHVLDPNGNELARLESDNWLSHPVIAADGTMIISDSNNTVLALGADGCEGQIAALHRPEDLSADWDFNFIDFTVMAADWLQCTDTSYDPVTKGQYCDYDGDEFFFAGDINRDQYVNYADVAQLANRWLTED